MSRLNEESLRIANEIIGRYPIKKSALIPLLHLAQEQEGSRRQSHRAPSIYILRISNLRPFSKGVPKENPNPKQTRTERTLAESRFVLI